MSSFGLLEVTPGIEDVPVVRPVPYWRESQNRLLIQAGLALLTFFSTTVIGMRYMYNFRMGLPPLVTDSDIFPYQWILHNMNHFADGLPFSLTLLGILLCHEFGHFAFCTKHNVKATLPYLLPAPTLSGTAGAVIRLKSRIRSRAALLHIGAAGPICGFIFAVPCTIIGLALSTHIAPGSSGEMDHFRVNSPLLIVILRYGVHLFRPNTPELLEMVPHPMLVASWVGIFITSLNLLPAGQLDGGHIVYAISPKFHKISTNAVIIAAIACGAGYWVGWLLWAVLLMLPGMKHPEVRAQEDLTLGNWNTIYFCGVLFILTGMLQPFNKTSLIDLLHHFHH